MQKEKRLVPELRFPEFEGEWEKSELDQRIDLLSGFAFKGEDISEDATGVPLMRGINITEGRVRHSFEIDRFYLGSTLKLEKYKLKKGDIVIGMDGSKVGKNIAVISENDSNSLLIQRVARIRAKKGTDTSFVYLNIFNPKFIRYVDVVNTSSGIPHISAKQIKEFKIGFPRLLEQQKIANFLTAIDSRLQNLEKKKSLLEEYKKGVLQQIFKQEIRFKDENGEEFPKWEKRKLSSVLFEHKLKSTGIEEVHSVSVHKGVINQIEHLGRSFSAKNTDHYSRVLPNDIIYTKSPTGDFPLGIIKQSHIKEDVIVSPLYGVFTPETKELGYILHVYFESPINTSNYLSSIIQKGAKNTINITNNTFLSKKMFLPVSKKEQTKIANFLSAIDNKILLTNDQIEKTKPYKKGLMQQMFV